MVVFMSASMLVNLSNEADMFVWKLAESGVFTVKSFYLDLMNGYITFIRKYLWELKITLKIIIFTWFLNKKAMLTKYNLAKRNRNGCEKCCFFLF